MSIISGVYGDDHFFRTNPDFVSQLQNSGFTRLTCFVIRVFEDGELYYGDNLICNNNGFVPGTQGQANWNTQLQQGKTGGTVNQILISIGGDTAGGVNVFTNIQTLLGNFDPNNPDKSNVLYKNFSALFAAMPEFDGVDLDVEDNFSDDNYNYFVRFCLMLDLIINP